MNEKTRQSLDKAKASNGSLISKKDFIEAVKEVFSPNDPLPKSGPAPGNFDNPYVGFVLRQSPRRFMTNPFLVMLQWFGADESLGYVVLFDHMFGNGGTIDHLKDILKSAPQEQIPAPEQKSENFQTPIIFPIISPIHISHTLSHTHYTP